MIIVFFIIFFIAKDAIPFFKLEGIGEFFTSTGWYPVSGTPKFGALAILYGTLMVTVGAGFIAIPMGIFAAVSLSDVMPFKLKQIIKPVLETLTAIPSVAYGFFALVVLAPILQNYGSTLLVVICWLVLFPSGLVLSYIFSNFLCRLLKMNNKRCIKGGFFSVFLILLILIIIKISGELSQIQIVSGTNALNVSLILGIMALPTIVSVSEDALNAVGRELRENSYALGATRAETIFKVVIPAARSGITAAVILGVMRALGETMVVWMASGNSSQIPKPFFNFLTPIRTLTATIAGEMGEAAHIQGEARYHVLFAMALILLCVSFLSNLISEWMVKKTQKKLRGEN
jgi:phosphate transport system permease protein